MTGGKMIEFIRAEAKSLLKERSYFNDTYREFQLDTKHVTRESALVMLEYVLVQIEALKNYD